MPKWLKETGPDSDVVISSRIRLARNIEATPFPQSLKEPQGREIINRVYDAVIEGNASLKNEFSLIEINSLNKLEKMNYVESNLISTDLLKHNDIGALLVNNDEALSIMINEEDHIRIQCMLPGLQLTEGWDLANKIDDLIEERVNYAFNERLGYLTSCPTNVGTGIRASVMMHLPVLNMTGYMNNVIKIAGQIGLAVRGIHGEGTEFTGNIYQISNQITLGLTEEEIIKNLQDVVRQIVQQERALRENLYVERPVELEDRIFRSYGLLKNARLITSNEAMKLISDLKLGVNLKLINDISLQQLNELMIMIQAGYIQKQFGGEIGEHERDKKRAELIRRSI